MQKLRVLELFAGIGAFSKALTNLGIEHEIVNCLEEIMKGFEWQTSKTCDQQNTN